MKEAIVIAALVAGALIVTPQPGSAQTREDCDTRLAEVNAALRELETTSRHEEAVDQAKQAIDEARTAHDAGNAERCQSWLSDAQTVIDNAMME